MSALEPGKARMTHPADGVEDAVVQASQVPHLEHSGWRYVEGDRETWPEEVQEAEGQNRVAIRHPVTGGTAVVPSESVPHLRERGWLVVGSDDDQAAEVDRLEDKTVEELRELAKTQGVSPLPTKKADLLAALTGEQQQNQDQAGGEPAPTEEDQG